MCTRGAVARAYAGGRGSIEAKAQNALFAIMAAALFASQMGPPIRDYVGRYDWKPAAPCCCLTGGGRLVAVDRDTLEWEDAKGCPCGPLHPVHKRDTENPDHFVGVDDKITCYPVCGSCASNETNVWVLTNPSKPLKFYTSREEASKGVAPSIVAMKREEDSEADSADAAPTDSTGRRVAGEERAKSVDKPLTQAQQDRAFVEKQKLEKKEAERLAIAEMVTNDRNKQKQKQASVKVPEGKQLSQAELKEAETKTIAKAIASDKLRRENKARLDA